MLLQKQMATDFKTAKSKLQSKWLLRECSSKLTQSEKPHRLQDLELLREYQTQQDGKPDLLLMLSTNDQNAVCPIAHASMERSTVLN